VGNKLHTALRGQSTPEDVVNACGAFCFISLACSVVLPQVLLALSVNLLRFAVNVSSSARLAGALLRVELLHPKS